MKRNEESKTRKRKKDIRDENEQINSRKTKSDSIRSYVWILSLYACNLTSDIHFNLYIWNCELDSGSLYTYVI